MNRRQLLLLGSSVAAISTGSLWLAMRRDEPSAWIETVVRKHLSGISLDAASLQTFATDLARTSLFSSRKISLALEVDLLAPTLVRLAPEVARRFERLERFVLSQFLLSSNFFRVTDPRTETIFGGAALTACGNPFAVFRTDSSDVSSLRSTETSAA